MVQCSAESALLTHRPQACLFLLNIIPNDPEKPTSAGGGIHESMGLRMLMVQCNADTQTPGLSLPAEYHPQ